MFKASPTLSHFVIPTVAKRSGGICDVLSTSRETAQP